MGDKTKPKKGKKKVVIIVLVVLVVVAAIIGSSVKKMTSQVATAVNTVEVEPVQKRDLSDTISLKGTVSGITKNNATSKALAEITAVNVQVGDIVKEGDVLCILLVDLPLRLPGGACQVLVTLHQGLGRGRDGILTQGAHLDHFHVQPLQLLAKSVSHLTSLLSRTGR